MEFVNTRRKNTEYLYDTVYTPLPTFEEDTEYVFDIPLCEHVP